MRLWLLPAEKYHMAESLVAEAMASKRSKHCSVELIKEALIQEAEGIDIAQLVDGAIYDTIGVSLCPGPHFAQVPTINIYSNYYTAYNRFCLVAETAWGGIHETRLRDGMLLLERHATHRAQL